MNKLFAILIAGAFSAVTASAYAADPATPAKPAEPAAASVKADKPVKKELTPQQQKMQDCNKEAKAKDMKGPDRKKFMSGCLKGNAKPTEAKKTDAKPADTKK